jgi:plasmid stabilization system protein ParE
VNSYRITLQAADDLKGIWRYTADNHGESQADSYVNTLKAGCEKIADTPTILILAFLHERMDFVTRLKERLS